MKRISSHPRTLLLIILLTICASLRAEKTSFETISGETITAELIGVYAGIVYFDTGRGKTIFINAQGLTPQSQQFAYEWLKSHLESLAKEPTKVKDSDSHLSAFLTKSLVYYKDGELEPYNFEEKAEPEFYAFYYSAHWCGPCRRFTPKLRAFYKAMRLLGHDNFEVIFVSSDRSAKMMEKYMEEDQMPWPAVKYGMKGNSLVSKYAGNGIPCLVITDRDGHLLYHSYRGDEYLGPSVPMDQLKKLLEYSAELKKLANRENAAQ